MQISQIHYVTGSLAPIIPELVFLAWKATEMFDFVHVFDNKTDVNAYIYKLTA